jgi:hypothetical protein
MAQRSYTIPMTGVVTVDADAGAVVVEVSLTDLSFDLRYDYDHQYPSAETERDQALVTDCLMQSPSNFSMKHQMDLSK